MEQLTITRTTTHCITITDQDVDWLDYDDWEKKAEAFLDTLKEDDWEYWDTEYDFDGL